MIQSEIWQITHLTCSVGVSYNKFLAKEASDYAKPTGITIIGAKDAMEFLTRLPIEKFRGVGKKTVPKMHELGINNGSNLLAWSQMDLIKQFGKFGYVLYERAEELTSAPLNTNVSENRLARSGRLVRPLITKLKLTMNYSELPKCWSPPWMARKSTARLWSSKFVIVTFQLLPSG